MGGVANLHLILVGRRYVQFGKARQENLLRNAACMAGRYMWYPTPVRSGRLQAVCCGLWRRKEGGQGDSACGVLIVLHSR